jgi:imidazolonepropionase-like amidohydrolase
MRPAIALLAVTVSVTAYAVSTNAAEIHGEAAAPRPIGITHVTVIDVEHGTRLRDQTIIIEGERIATIGLSSQVRIPDGYGIVEGRGKFVIPGLIDTHSHLARNADSATTSGSTNHPLEPFVPFGVTTLQEVSSYALDVAVATLRDTRDREAPLPRLRVSTNVDRWYIASAGAIRPLRGSESAQDTAFSDSLFSDSLVRLMVERRVWLAPTLVTGSSDGAMRFVRRFHDAGGIVIAATDGPRPSGAAMHDEVRLLVAAGLTPAEALRAATFDAARTMGWDKRVGSVVVGKLADLLILDADPLLDIRNTSRIDAITLGGRFIDGAERQALLDRLTASRAH